MGGTEGFGRVGSMGEDCGCVQLWSRVLLFFPPPWVLGMGSLGVEFVR